MWFDSHCHLYDCKDHGTVAERDRSAGVADVLIPGVDVSTSRRALELAAANEWWAAAGFHPTEMRDWNDALVEEIEPLLDDPRVIAIGETGLDFHWDTTFNDDQLRGFAAHVELAKRRDLALVIHTRDSVDAAIELLSSAGAPQRSIFHCWSGDRDQLGAALALGAFVSFAGNVTFARADELRAVAVDVPADRLLLETDAPYLAPVPHRGKPNEPAHVVRVGEALAAARGITPEEIAQQTTANAKRAFGIDK